MCLVVLPSQLTLPCSARACLPVVVSGFGVSPCLTKESRVQHDIQMRVIYQRTSFVVNFFDSLSVQIISRFDFSRYIAFIIYLDIMYI